MYVFWSRSVLTNYFGFLVVFLQDIQRGVSYLKLRPDRVAMQDATAQVTRSLNGVCKMLFYDC